MRFLSQEICYLNVRFFLDVLINNLQKDINWNLKIQINNAIKIRFIISLNLINNGNNKINQ